VNPFLLQIIATILFAFALVKDKSNIERFKIHPREYTFVVFTWLTFFAFIAMLFTRQVDWLKLAQPQYYFGLILLIVLAFGWNKLFYYFEDREQMQDFEVVNLTVPAMTALLGGIVYPEERSLLTFVAVVVSFGALMAARAKKHHFKVNRYTGTLLFMVFVMAAETVLRKFMLDVFDPATLYFVRVLFVWALLYIFYRPRKLTTDWQVWGHAAISNIFGVTAMIIMFYGYQEIGVILTTMVFLLNPILVYLLSARYLQERIRMKNIYASLVILAAIILVAILN